ncbi:MAG: hypothetical protein IJK04_06920 [Kiritimatiellae bacterium]|nr:hypothetical protein [Kiritimatiellia bacterium]
MSNANFNPDSLLKDINKSILTKGIVIALVAHAIIIFGTSFSLYRDWAKYGVKTPSAIKAQKKEEKVAADKAKREEEIKRKAEESAALASNAAPAQASSPAKTAAPAGSKAAEAKTDGTVKPPEIQPLKPASTDELSLDDIGL